MYFYLNSNFWKLYSSHLINYINMFSIFLHFFHFGLIFDLYKSSFHKNPLNMSVLSKKI
jgi:hypothetical protein